MNLKIKNPKIKIFFLAILFIAIFGMSAKASAATYYVKNGGNDALSGLDDANAWAHCPGMPNWSGAVTLANGDTVYFRSQDIWAAPTGSRVLAIGIANVTYDGETYGSGTRAKFEAIGDHSNGAYGMVDLSTSNTIFRGFELDGNDYWNSGILIGNSATENITNIMIDNVDVHDIMDTGDSNVTGHWGYGINVISTANPGIVTSNLSILNSSFHNNNHEGIAMYAPWGYPGNKIDGVLIRNCVSRDNGSALGAGCGLEMANDVDNVTVEYSTLINNNGYGIVVRTSPEGENGAPNNFIARNNLISGNVLYGVAITNVQGLSETASFYNNLIYNNGITNANGNGAEFALAGGYDYTGSVFNVYNNTIYSTGNENTNFKAVVAIGFFGVNTGEPEVNFRNNIVYGDDLIPVIDQYNVMTHSNNLVYRSSGLSDTHISSGTSYNRAGVLTWEASAQTTDPNFTGGTLPTGFNGTYGTNMLPNTNYFATISGPTINTGATLGSPYNLSINSAGFTSPFLRPQGGAYDIGAYELQGADTVPPSVPSGLAVE
ncbi:MAG: right-handed parallel beta-helix repeat-containing protein [Parcubacteria group bacterium]|jgi:hypothetical protein